MPGSIDLDFGVLSFAANPFYEALCQSEGRPNDHASHINLCCGHSLHRATAHAIRQLGRHGQNQGAFENHPYEWRLSSRTEFGRTFLSDRCDEVVCFTGKTMPMTNVVLFRTKGPCWQASWNTSKTNVDWRISILCRFALSRLQPHEIFCTT